MPIYAYRCAACGHSQDVLQKISDPLLTVCPACGEHRYVKQLTAAGFQLKGSGWYVTDFRGGKAGAKDAARDDAGEGGAKDAAAEGAKGDGKEGKAAAGPDAAAREAPAAARPDPAAKADKPTAAPAPAPGKTGA